MDHRPTAVRVAGALAAVLFASACSDRVPSPLAPTAPSASLGSTISQEEVLEHAVIHRTVEGQRQARAAGAAATGNNLYYHGGTGGIGVETAPRVYVVFWGSQWNNNDPSGEAAIVQNFLRGAGGSKWLNSVTQYCQGVASGTVYCNGAGTAAGNPTGILVSVWYDNASSASSKPRQSQLAAEAVRAAAHFGNTSASSNASTQYVIATAHGSNSSGFGTQYCAYHSSTSSSYGNVAYTNLPYITDAGASCGANFNGLGPKAGITIVRARRPTSHSAPAPSRCSRCGAMHTAAARAAACCPTSRRLDGRHRPIPRSGAADRSRPRLRSMANATATRMPADAKIPLSGSPSLQCGHASRCCGGRTHSPGGHR
jgi:hypothetical protein